MNKLKTRRCRQSPQVVGVRVVKYSEIFTSISSGMHVSMQARPTACPPDRLPAIPSGLLGGAEHRHPTSRQARGHEQWSRQASPPGRKAVTSLSLT